jgi:hypothetical protein
MKDALQNTLQISLMNSGTCTGGQHTSVCGVQAVFRGVQGEGVCVAGRHGMWHTSARLKLCASKFRNARGGGVYVANSRLGGHR